jgi:uncharacterized BrkB/YihY/UPF0761 family membrane protein
MKLVDFNELTENMVSAGILMAFLFLGLWLGIEVAAGNPQDPALRLSPGALMAVLGSIFCCSMVFAAGIVFIVWSALRGVVGLFHSIKKNWIVQRKDRDERLIRNTERLFRSLSPDSKQKAIQKLKSLTLPKNNRE